MTPDHPLDRPVWSALTSRQASLAIASAVGDGLAMRFDPDHALFAVARDDGADSLAALAALVPSAGSVGLVEAGPVALPQGVDVRQAACVQMTTGGLTRAGDGDVPWEPLGEADAADMLALATLTEPGPFFGRTHSLGDFVGVKRDGRLVAMAGERMKPDGFTEVSGVCTHPDWRGRGYAAGLMQVVVDRILKRGETAFLHAYAANTGAIALYRSLGFAIRTPITFTVMTALGERRNERTYGHG